MTIQNSALAETVDLIGKKINREIWIVTAAAGTRRGGLVATWVTQASIDSEQPIYIAGIAPNHFTAQLIDQSNRVGLHLLKQTQLDVAWNFAIGSGRDRDKLVDLTTRENSDLPLLEDALAWMDCTVIARLETGDRTYYWLRPAAASCNDGEPLRERDLFAAATPEQKESLLENRDFDIRQQRPLARHWLSNLPDLLQPRAS